MKDFADRLRRAGVAEDVVSVVLRTLYLEQANISYKRPPRIIKDIQDVIHEAAATKEDDHAP